MSEEAKKNLRTQGKYSNENSVHKYRDKRLKDSPGERDQPEKKSQKRNSYGHKQNTSYGESESESSVKYQDNSSHSFNALEDDKKPVEIRDRGEHVISETINGKSIVIYEPEFIKEDEADYYLYAINDTTEWNEKNIIILGKEYPQPRLVAWYGPFPYSYSGVTLEPKEMPENVLRIKHAIEDFLSKYSINVKFNSVLLNCYRDGKDSVAWHSDDELTMGVCPTIASISLGEIRKFEMRRKKKSYEEEVDDGQIDLYYVNLTKGSLLVMNGCMQQDWQHRIPKEYHSRRMRINLTFRTVYSLENIPPEIASKEYKDNQITSKTWDDTSSSCEISYDEKNFPPLGHSVALNEKNFPPLGHSVAHSEKNFPLLGRSDATSGKMDTGHEISDHEMDVEIKDAYLNSTSMNSTDSYVDSNISANFESSYSVSEELNNSTEYSDNSQNQNTYVGSDMNNLNDDKQNFKHELNKNVHTFDNPLNDSDSMNPVEDSVVHDKSYTNSSSTSKKHINDSWETPVKPLATFCSIGPSFSQISNLNANAKEFVPSSVSSPVSEEHIDDHISLEKLLTYNLEDMENDDIIDYAYHLRDEILKKIRVGKYIDELHVLCDLMEDSLPIRCQKKITTRMCELVKRYREADNSRKFNNKPFRHAQQPIQREHSSSSRGRGYLSRRNDNFRKQESSGRESSNRENFNRDDEYTRRSDFRRGYSESRKESFERGNSNREDDSKRGHLNREEHSGGERRMTNRGGRNPGKSFGRGESYGGMEYRRNRT